MSARPDDACDACGVCQLSRGGLRTVCFQCRAACSAAVRTLAANLAGAGGLEWSYRLGGDFERRLYARWSWRPGCGHTAPGFDQALSTERHRIRTLLLEVAAKFGGPVGKALEEVAAAWGAT